MPLNTAFSGTPRPDKGRVLASLDNEDEYDVIIRLLQRKEVPRVLSGAVPSRGLSIL